MKKNGSTNITHANKINSTEGKNFNLTIYTERKNTGQNRTR